ncbi:ATP-binding protein, partial [Neobacillus drentensis]|uniref:ATP-binding protein n=1 Tax=Neobacillus drentensis TaxID=220684 RepID=UPI0030013EE3
MNEGIKSSKLLFEEKKAIKLFLWLFYFFFVTFDLFWYFVLPKYTSYGKNDFPESGLGYWLYFWVFSLLPISIYFIKKGNPYLVKYIFLLGYLLIDIIDNLLIYSGNSLPFASGNIVELLFLFFSPIFVNKKYFWTVFLGIVGKYILLGLVLQDANVLPPIIMTIILSAIAFILLIRFYSYISSLTSVHEKLRQKEKLAVIGRMAAAIGHEIRNPLASLKGFTQLQQERNQSTNEFYPIMIQEIDRINLIVNDLMDLGKPRVTEFEKASIEEVITYTLSIIQQQADRQGVIIETMMPGPIPPIDCDEKQLKQVFINLIKNAIESMSGGGTIKINTNVLHGQKLHIIIQDDGIGIDEKDIINLGEPFFTTKKDGTGLGLMVSNQIIMDHNGEINIESNIG